MKISKSGLFGLLAAAALCVPIVAHSAGMWQNWPGVGAPSYCSAIVGSSNVQAGQTGQGAGTVGSNGTYCAQTTPAGPSVFAGSEQIPVDVGPPGAVNGSSPTSYLVSIGQLGQGQIADVTSPTTAQIPAYTPYYFLDGAQASAFTITMPANPLEGQLQKIVCESTTAGTMTVAANSGSSIKGNPNSACSTQFTAYSWRYVASNTTWYRY